MIRAKDGNGCCSSWCCCIRQQIAELWQRIEGTVRGVKMNGNIIEPDGDGIVDLDVNFPVDGAMDPASTNPVQNRVVTDAILTERNERIEDDRRHDLQIQGLQGEMATKLTTPSGGVQGQVLGMGAQGIGWVDTITEQRAQQMAEDIASVDGRLTQEISDREAGDTAVRDWVQNSYQVKPTGTPDSGDVIGWDGNKAAWQSGKGGLEVINMNNWPTDWQAGDMIEMLIECPISWPAGTPDWDTAPTGVFTYNAQSTRLVKVEAIRKENGYFTEGISFENPFFIVQDKLAIVYTMNIQPNGMVFGNATVFNGSGYLSSASVSTNDPDVNKQLKIAYAARLRASRKQPSYSLGPVVAEVRNLRDPGAWPPSSAVRQAYDPCAAVRQAYYSLFGR